MSALVMRMERHVGAIDRAQLASALRELHRVCLAMDAPDENDRPTEAEYQAAMQRADEALGE